MKIELLTIKEMEALMPIVDAGIKATGVQIFRAGRGGDLQSALAKLQGMAQHSAERQAAQAQAARDAESAEAPPMPNGGADEERAETAAEG